MQLTEPKTLAIFDLDNTLLAGDSDHAWGEFLIAKQLVDAVEYRHMNDRFYRAYQDGTLDIHEFLAFALRPLTRHEPERLRELHREFMTSHIQPLMLDKAAQLLDDHRRRGHLLLIITATNSFITRPIAEALGVDALLATEPEQVNGRFTGAILGTPCFQEGKVIRLREWLEQHSHPLEGSYFYSDSANDLPLLEQVSHPVAVDPDPRLAETARQRSWPIISLRE